MSDYTGAKLMAEHFDYPWGYMPTEGRENLRVLAEKVAEAETVNLRKRFAALLMGLEAGAVFMQADESVLLLLGQAIAAQAKESNDLHKQLAASDAALLESRANDREAMRQLGEYKQDAERYRWLCNVATESQWIEFGGYTVKKHVDAAIDSAMTTQENQS